MLRTSSYKNNYFSVEVVEADSTADGSFSNLILLTRSAVPFASFAEIDAGCIPVQLHLDRIGRKGKRILVDTRDAVGNNDPAFEKRFDAHRMRMVQGFEAVAILVRTPVGRLQNQRLAEKVPAAVAPRPPVDTPPHIRVFMSWDDALAHLQTYEAEPSSNSKRSR